MHSRQPNATRRLPRVVARLLDPQVPDEHPTCEQGSADVPLCSQQKLGGAGGGGRKACSRLMWSEDLHSASAHRGHLRPVLCGPGGIVGWVTTTCPLKAPPTGFGSALADRHGGSGGGSCLRGPPALQVCWKGLCEDFRVYRAENCSAKCSGHGVRGLGVTMETCRTNPGGQRAGPVPQGRTHV